MSFIQSNFTETTVLGANEPFDASPSNNSPGIEKKTDGPPADSRNILVFNPLPANNSLNNPTPLPFFAITVSHLFAKEMNITWQTNITGTWVTFNSTTKIHNGTYTTSNTSWVTGEKNITYWWRTLVNDYNFSWTNATYCFTTGFNYTEQPPPPPSEWDDIYEKYTLVSQEADIHYNQVSQDGTGNFPKMVMKYKLKDRYFDTYYETGTAFNITATPGIFWFNFPKTTNISFMRYYFYDPHGMNYAPAVYQIYNGSTYLATYNITPQVNGQWVRINFSKDLVLTTNFTLKILQTRGSIDQPDTLTKVVINEIELFENTTPRTHTQDPIPLYSGTTKFWNNLDWALSLRIDDCYSLSSFPDWWADILPITAICYNPSYTINVTLVDTKHMEVGSHGSISDHKANYNKTYSWWRPRADAAKASIETYTIKTSLWSEKCISFGIPYSVLEPPGGRALYDAGFKHAGWLNNVPGWKVRILGRQNLSLYNVSEPKSQVPMDWMFIEGPCHAKWDHDAILLYKQNRSYAHLMMHPYDHLDPNFISFIQNDITAWHCTMGEIASYWWYTQRMNVTYNASSNDTEKIFDINILEYDPNIWEVPITFSFNLTDFYWHGNITVKWRNNNTVYTTSLPNISRFSAGPGQHRNQTMREGYRWDFGNHMLYVSVKPGDMEKPKSLYLFISPNRPPNTPNNPNPSNGQLNVNISTILSWTSGDPDGGPVTCDVYFGTTSIPLKVSSNQSTAAYNPGALNYSQTYFWKIVAWDNHGASTLGPIWQFITEDQNTPPQKPAKPSGQTSGDAGTVYTYITSTTDPDEDQLYYKWDWGDENYSAWLGPSDSGGEVSASHTWIKGTYAIKVKAKDTSGAESPWSDPLPITMPLDVVSGNTLLLKQVNQFPNTFPLGFDFFGHPTGEKKMDKPLEGLRSMTIKPAGKNG